MKPVIKSSSGHLIFMVMLLAAVISIMVVLKSTNFGFQKSSPKFDGDFEIVDDKYYNMLYHFGVDLPNSDWEMLCFENIDSLLKQDLDLMIVDNINIVAQMNRLDKQDTLSIVQIGIIELVEPRTPHSMAAQSLEEINSAFGFPDTVRVVQDVTSTGASSLRGAYYMIEFPEKSNYPYPVWIALFLVRNKIAYATICQVKSDFYGYLRSDFEDIFKSFRLFKN